MPKPRITIPPNTPDLIKLAVAIQEQHTALGKTSPLTMLDWDEAAPEIKDASDVQKQIDKLGKDLEKLVERRNNYVEPLGDFVRSSRDVLAGVYRSEIRKLTDFGFKVDTTPKQKKTKAEPPAK